MCRLLRDRISSGSDVNLGHSSRLSFVSDVRLAIQLGKVAKSYNRLSSRVSRVETC